MSDERIGKKSVNGRVSEGYDLNLVYIIREIHLVSNYNSLDINLYYSSVTSKSRNLRLGSEYCQCSQLWVKQKLVQFFSIFKKILTRCQFCEAQLQLVSPIWKEGGFICVLFYEPDLNMAWFIWKFGERHPVVQKWETDLDYIGSEVYDVF